MSRVHELKTHPVPFDAVWNGRKPYEIRKNDRDYQTGDLLYLRCWAPEGKAYTGRAVLAEVTYMTPGGAWGLPAELCVLGLREISRTIERTTTAPLPSSEQGGTGGGE